MAMAHIVVKMEPLSKENIEMDKNMEQVLIPHLMDVLEWVSGSMEREHNGLNKIKYEYKINMNERKYIQN